MIFDTIANADLYKGISPLLAKGLTYLQETDLASLEVGRIELEGTDLYVLIQEYDSRTPEKGKWEAHRRYIDIQYVISGEECIGYRPLEDMETVEYNETKDVAVLKGEGAMMLTRAGSFGIYFPQDAHQPCMAVDQPMKVKKAVVKVRVG